MAIIAGDANRVKQADSCASVALFVCTNCMRENDECEPPTTGGRPAAHIVWPVEVEEVTLPCTGKIQPEHLLKAFEAGADMVCVVGCEEDNCHCLEGSRRAGQRVQWVRQLLDEAGLGGDRLLMFHLPGTAREDMALGVDLWGPPSPGEASQTRIRPRLQTICDEIMAKLESLGPNPLRGDGATLRSLIGETE